MRLLLVSHPPLSAELGAAQTALNLAAALRARGHDVVTWSPEPLPSGIRWWSVWKRQREKIERFAAAHGPFEAIDTPAISASPGLARQAPLVVRSIQPELRYLVQGLRGDFERRPFPPVRVAAHASLASWQAAAILAGWRRAVLILCLGTLELGWMRRRFPFWASRLGLYVCAPSAAEQSALREVRKRRSRPEGQGTRFLWLGRWASHKGTARLLRFLRRRLLTHSGETFTLAGCGPAAERDCPADWLRSGRVRLLPAFTRAELPDLLARHDAGLFTSRVEGWGQSLNEMLEAGLPVFATPAGAVADLHPFFPRSLRPFPPPAVVEPAAEEDLEANGYYARFSWPEIAASYERQVLGALAR